jgi:hypothetical protein
VLETETTSAAAEWAKQSYQQQIKIGVDQLDKSLTLLIANSFDL